MSIFLTSVKRIPLSFKKALLQPLSVSVGTLVILSGPATWSANIKTCYTITRDAQLAKREALRNPVYDERFYVRSSFVVNPDPYAFGHQYSTGNANEKIQHQIEYQVYENRLLLMMSEIRFKNGSAVSRHVKAILLDENCTRSTVETKEVPIQDIDRILEHEPLYKAPVKDQGEQLLEANGRKFAYTLRSLPPVRILSPLTHTLEKINRTEFSIAEAAMTAVEFSDSLGRLLHSAKTDGGNLNQRTDFFAKDDWLKLSPKSNPQVIGASNENILSHAITARISGQSGRLSAEEFRFYFEILNQWREVSSWAAILHFQQPHDPVSLGVDGPVSEEDRKLLLFDQKIQQEPVRDIVDQLRQRAQGKTRLELARMIGQELQKHIRYEEKPGLGFNTAEILKSGAGICYHFSILYTAIARSLGLPTRIRSGRLVRSHGLSPHAWVEIKINASDWWPFEPQMPDGRFFQRGYIPMGLMHTKREIDIEALLRPAIPSGLETINRFEVLQ